MKRALQQIGEPIDKANVEGGHIWESLSIKGLMDKVDHIFSIFPLTNEKILKQQRRELEAIRNKPKPPV